MTTLEIILGKSIGDITFGMARSEARNLLGVYREFRSYVKNVNSYDQFSFCNLGYDANNEVEFISIHSVNEIALMLNNRIISDMAPLELFSFIRKLDPSVELEDGGVGFVSHFLGFAAYFEKTPVLLLSIEQESECQKLEAVTIAVKDYWRK